MLFPISSSQTYLILGMGKSGRATKEFLRKQGAQVLTFDDNKKAQADFNLDTIHLIPLEKITAVIQSPGIAYQYPSPHPLTALAQKKNIPIFTDINFLQQHNPLAKYIGITGTNGKSTTTALIAHLLDCYKKPFAMGGNIGIPALELPSLGKEETYVLELSSYQLEISPALELDIAVWLNITEDHLDRHETLENYIEAKKRIFLQAKQVVIGIDDPFSNSVCRLLLENSVPVLSVSYQHEADICVKEGILYHQKREVLNLNDCKKLKGSHNHQNAAMTYAVSYLLSIPIETIQKTLLTFPGLAHRQEIVRSHKNILFVNDSKATNADAVSYALETYKKHPIYWILGGVSKSQGITPLENYFPLIRHAFLIGKAQQEFAETLENKVPYTYSEEIQTALQQAIEQIQQDHYPYDSDYPPVVLLSPACASFDQFENFEQRGDFFRHLVHQLI